MSTTQAHVGHHEPPEVVGKRERLGVRLLIIADGAFVFGLIFSYLYLQNLDANGGWLPDEAHRMSANSGWLIAIPLVVAALSHFYGTIHRRSFKAMSLITLVSLVVGAYLQWSQLATMPFIGADSGVFEGSYASMWMLMSASSLFHYSLGIFVALGLAIRAQRVHLDPVLETWRLRTAGSWLTWIAISGVACAFTLSMI